MKQPRIQLLATELSHVPKQEQIILDDEQGLM